MKIFFFVVCVASLTTVSAEAATIEGRVASISVEGRTLTLAGGEVLSLTEAVAVEDLRIDQVVRADYIDGTTDVTSIDVLEAAPVTSVDEPILEE